MKHSEALREIAETLDESAGDIACYAPKIGELRKVSEMVATLRSAASALDASEKRADALAKALRDAQEKANGRWCEWGERAVAVADIIEDALEADAVALTALLPKPAETKT